MLLSTLTFVKNVAIFATSGFCTLLHPLKEYPAFVGFGNVICLPFSITIVLGETVSPEARPNITLQKSFFVTAIFPAASFTAKYQVESDVILPVYVPDAELVKFTEVVAGFCFPM